MAARRSVEIPRTLTDPRRWPGYLAGMMTEAAYVLVLIAAALLIALAARVIWP
ncbi:MAG: hypothetical protein QMD76_01675 [Anaerosomatales bacterium]|nr:hypothetical protein [Coriobacteriia bacterium]MDI6692010.1 hypothetical protein [Anaerosomatales bacterium]MDI6843151.1 hypothetical protein [Anaerosomatales bacterium]